MRKGFTLIELMIVIAIIAIIAAIAIPNLLESRITANEANAATSLKSGVFPGQTQFQNGGYVDVDSDGRGIYAAHVAYLAGATGSGSDLDEGPNKALSLLDPKFNNGGSDNTNPTTSTPANASRVGAYDFGLYVDVTTEDNGESFWGGVAAPAKTDGSEARRAFAVNAAGTVYQTKGTVTYTDASDFAALDFGGSAAIFGTDPTLSVATVDTQYATPFQK